MLASDKRARQNTDMSRGTILRPEAWQKEYNESRPHRSLNNLSPAEYKAKWAHNQPENH